MTDFIKYNKGPFVDVKGKLKSERVRFERFAGTSTLYQFFVSSNITATQVFFNIGLYCNTIPCDNSETKTLMNKTRF